MVSALNSVLATIASTVLGDSTDAPVTAGAITLHAHQRDALCRVRSSVERSGGALLADEPGLGKTYVALALAHDFRETVVIAPAALRAMWHEAAIAAGVVVSFMSTEALSRRDIVATLPGDPEHALVIVDEAHHVCNPATARYARLARLVAYRRVLLLSATPVRNRMAELSALLALFLGPRAYTLDDAARGRCIVRHVNDTALLPVIDGPHWHRIRFGRQLRDMISTLPPPLPALDGREASALLTITLARCWASSLAALDSALRRRMQRGAALSAILDDGRLPTRDELRAWVVGDDAVQLAFPMLAAHRSPHSARLREVLDAHLEGVRAIRARIRRKISGDSAQRAQLLVELRTAHPNSQVIAFASHAATAEALYHVLRAESGVALLTARGARTAGGSRPRSDIINALAGAARSTATHDGISLVITTDLLSEGVNLQGASVVVHLDIPWTPAALEQRVGRAARMGSQHERVHVHGFAPPAAAEGLLALERHFARKHVERIEAARVPQEVEQLRAAVAAWPECDRVAGRACVAYAHSKRRGFIASVLRAGVSRVVCGMIDKAGRWKASDSPGDLSAMALAVHISPAAPDQAFESAARAALARWLAARRARDSSGAGASPSHARRALLARIDGSLRAAGAHARATQAHRIAAVRASIDGAVSAGAERVLAEIASADAGDLDSWLTLCETRLSGGVARRPAADAELPEICALLLLCGPA